MILAHWLDMHLHREEKSSPEMSILLRIYNSDFITWSPHFNLHCRSDLFLIYGAHYHLYPRAFPSLKSIGIGIL